MGRGPAASVLFAMTALVFFVVFAPGFAHAQQCGTGTTPFCSAVDIQNDTGCCLRVGSTLDLITPHENPTSNNQEQCEGIPDISEPTQKCFGAFRFSWNGGTLNRPLFIPMRTRGEFLGGVAASNRTDVGVGNRQGLAGLEVQRLCNRIGVNPDQTNISVCDTLIEASDVVTALGGARRSFVRTISPTEACCVEFRCIASNGNDDGTYAPRPEVRGNPAFLNFPFTPLGACAARGDIQP